MSNVAMIIKSTAAAGKRGELYELYREHLAPRAEENEAQEVVVWCADQQNPDVFVLFEVYRDSDALNTNGSSSWFADYMAAAIPLLAGPPDIVMATPQWSTGLPETTP